MHFRQGQKIQLVVLSDNISIRKTLQGRKHREAQIFEIKNPWYRTDTTVELFR